MPDKMTILGLPNYVGEAYTTVSAPAVGGLVPTGLEASWLKTEEPSEVARLASLDPLYTRWFATFGGLTHAIAGLAIANHNIYDGGQVRFLGYTGGNDPASPTAAGTAAPNVIASQNNTSGTITVVDETISTDDGLALVPVVSNLNWWARFSWPVLNAGIPLPVGTESYFVLRMICLASGAGAADPTAWPCVTVSLYESGVLIRQLGKRAVNVGGTFGQIFVFPFAFSELAAPDGSNLECRVDATPGTSLSGNQYAVLGAIRLYYEAPTSGTHTYDSGWITVPGDGSPRKQEPTRSLHYFPAVPWSSVSGVTMIVRGDQSRISPPTDFAGRVPVGAVKVADQFIQAGVWCAGFAFASERGLRRSGPNAGPAGEGFGGRAAAGQTYGADAFRFREADPVEVLLRRSEVDFLQEELGWRRGFSAGAFYVVLEPNVSLEQQRMTAFWATLRGMGKPVPFGRYKPNGEMLFAMSLRFEEKL